MNRKGAGIFGARQAGNAECVLLARRHALSGGAGALLERRGGVPKIEANINNFIVKTQTTWNLRKHKSTEPRKGAKRTMASCSAAVPQKHFSKCTRLQVVVKLDCVHCYRGLAVLDVRCQELDGLS